MQYIKRLQKELLIILAGFLILIVIAFFMYDSLNIAHKKINQIMAQEVQTEAVTVKNDIDAFLNRNKVIFDKSFFGITVDREVLSYSLKRYIMLAQKQYIQSVYFVKEKNNKIIFLYPNKSKNSIPLNVLEDSNSLINNINTARNEKRSLYFNCFILNSKLKTEPAVMLIKPFFNELNQYKGAVVEVINIQNKLHYIFSYIKDYSVEISIHKIDKENSNIYTVPLNIDKGCSYIKVKHSCISKQGVFKNIHDTMLNVLFMVITSFILLVLISIALIRKSNKEIKHKHILRKLNKRIGMLEDTVTMQEDELSQHTIKKVLKMSNDIFEADLSGIFFKNTNSNYVFDGNIVKKYDYSSIKGSISAYAWENKKDIMVNDFENVLFISDEIKKETNIKSSMCSLISFKGHNYGVVCTGSKKTKNAYTKEDFDFLKLIAHNIAFNMYYSSLSKNITEILLNSIEARDSYTEGHSRRVGEYAKFIAKVLGFDEEFQKNILTAGLFHDVGKVGIPDIVLLKPTRLSPNEYEIMKLHSSFSYEILKNVEMLKTVLSGIRGHHERWDGKGYPDGLSKDDIPITARILAVADSFDAITTLRPYKSAMTLSQTKQELIENASTQFDPNIIEKIIPYIDEMYNLGKILIKNKKPFFPKFVEDARKNIFYTDWFTGLMTMDYFEIIMNNLISKNMDFYVCRIDVVDFSNIKYQLGRRKASEIILTISNILKTHIGDEVARTSEDVFTFIIKENKNPKTLLKEIVEKLEEKIDYSIRFSYVSYSLDGKNADELIYNLDIKHKKAGYRI